MKINATFGGASQIANNIKSIQRAMGNALEDIAWAGAQPFLEEAKARVPVKTGNLRDHIHIETVQKSGTKATARVTPVTESGNKWGWDPAYAYRIEKGFHGEDSLGRHYDQDAQPYMQPAWETRQNDAMTAMKSTAADSIDEAMMNEINSRSGSK